MCRKTIQEKERVNMFVYSYCGYTITQNFMTGRCDITYPNEIESSIYTYSLEKAYQFVDEMVRG